MASRGESSGGLQCAKDGSSREMRKSKGLIKTLKLVPNEVSRRSALEESQALSREQCLFPDGVVMTHPGTTPTLPLEGNLHQSRAGGRGPEHPHPEGTQGGLAGSALVVSRGRLGQAGVSPDVTRAG